MKKWFYPAVSLLIAWAILHWVGQWQQSRNDDEIVRTESSYRVSHPDFHHSLKPLVSVERAVWGERRFRVDTNSLGFRDESPRQVSLRPERRRLLFLGNSFTEGIGNDWGQTFVGQFANARPDLEILNAGLTSYSPVIFQRVVDFLLREGYQVDEVVIYLDVSNVQDEGYTFAFDSKGQIERELKSCPWVWIGDYEASRLEGWSATWIPFARQVQKWSLAHLPNTSRLGRAALSPLWTSTASRGLLDDPEHPLGNIRGMWPQRDDLPCYGADGVSGAVALIQERMTTLATTLKRAKIPFSIAVYPWPEQLAHENEQSAQVEIWRRWCEAEGCRRFINHFPDFFARKGNDSYPRDLFLTGDTHYNVQGNRLISDRLQREFNQ